MRKLSIFRALFVAFVVVSFGGIIAAVSEVQAATLNVPSEYPDIQAAINAASDDDVVIVNRGTLCCGRKHGTLVQGVPSTGCHVFNNAYYQ